jgi:hypothetical protein
MSRKAPPLRERLSGPATPDEKYVQFRTANLEELAAAYGSVDAAARRYRELREAGELFEPAGQRAEVWWASEPGVPSDLRPLEQPRGAKGHVNILPVEVVARRQEWLAAHGHLTPREQERLGRQDRYREVRWGNP